MRLFIAIEIPDDLKKALGKLRLDIPGARQVPDGQIHLTLAFLGEVDEETVATLTGELSRIRSPSFELCLSGAGCFPDRRRPRVLWVGLEQEQRLNDLVDLLRKAALECGIPQEDRPFSAHITLARFKIPASIEVGAFLEQHAKLGLRPFPVREFTLFQSLLTPQETSHIPLKIFSLAET